MVPRQDTAAQAQGVGRRAALLLPKTHQDKLVVIQMETRGALDDLAAFLRVDGIHVYVIGPVDLAKSLGYAGDYRRPEVQQAIDETIAKIRAACP